MTERRLTRLRRDSQKLIEGVSATEISMMENQLIKEGMPVAEVPETL